MVFFIAKNRVTQPTIYCSKCAHYDYAIELASYKKSVCYYFSILLIWSILRNHLIC